MRTSLVLNRCRLATRIAAFQLVLLLGFTATAAESPLTIGSLKTSSSHTSITLSVSAPLSGGSGHGYVYHIYRSLHPHFVPGKGNLLATINDLHAVPYRDHSGLQPQTMYFYKVVGQDSEGDVANAVPAGLGNVKKSSPLSIPASLKAPLLNIVYIGDSITYGAKVPRPKLQAPPVICSQALGALYGCRNVYMSNRGRGGATTVDFLPSTHTLFRKVETAASQLIHAHPGLLVFSIMLGANDSANSQPLGAPVSPDHYRKNLETIINRLLADFPNSEFFVHDPIWYSPNTHNAANYEESGLDRLTTYFSQITKLISFYQKSHPGHVFMGDKTGYYYFAAHYLTQLTPQRGHNGVFYLHPNISGSAKLGRLWADAIASRLYLKQK